MYGLGGTEVDTGSRTGNWIYQVANAIPVLGSGLEVGEMIDSCAVF